MATYRFDIDSQPRDGSTACVALDSGTLSTLASVVAGWGTANPTWGFAQRQGSTSTFSFLQNGLSLAQQNGTSVTSASAAGFIGPLATTESLTVTTLDGASIVAGNHVLIAAPGSNNWYIATCLSVGS